MPQLRRALRAALGLNGGCRDIQPFSVGGEEGDEPLSIKRLGHGWETLAYGETQISEEVAYIAYHFHWPLEQILSLEHSDRRRWAQQISAINERMNEESGNLAVM